ncbi:hypothetical protein ScPMuIL_001350 [Solemya velum]
MTTAQEKIALMSVRRHAAFKKLEQKLAGLKYMNAYLVEQVSANTPFLQTSQCEDPEIRRITQLGFAELRDMLQRGELKAVDVVRAYQVKALEVNRELNCITEPVLEAEAIAIALDKMENKKGLFHGIPISVKENLKMEGYSSTIGFAHQLDFTAKTDSAVVQVLLEEGAIPLVRTNVAQTLMTIECSNPVYGETLNPHDLSRSSGGSSGGEGALIGAGGSILGIGNDSGGCLRIPASFCGVYALKPTSKRISLQGTLGLANGQDIVNPTNGPMSRDLDGLVQFSKALFAERAFSKDNYVAPISFRNEIYEKRKPLTIGYCYNDGHMSIAKSNVRAVHVTKNLLEAAGHKLVPFSPANVGRAMAYWSDGSFGDRCEDLISKLEKDIVDDVMLKAYNCMKDHHVCEDDGKRPEVDNCNLEEGIRYCAKTSNTEQISSMPGKRQH